MQKLTTKQYINIALILLTLVFVGINIEPVRVSFLFFGIDMPLIILMAVLFFIGYLVAILSRKSEK
jgi:uncharacterized integral membrane protein